MRSLVCAASLCAAQVAGLGAVGPSNDSSAEKALFVRNLVMQDAPAVADVPTVRVSFEILNSSEATFGEVAVAVRLVEARKRLPDVVALVTGPITVSARKTLRPGQHMTFELRLKNVTTACECVPKVVVVSAVPVAPRLEP